MNRVLLLLTVLALVVTTACAAPNPLAGTGGTSAPAPRAQAPAAPATSGQGGQPASASAIPLPPGYGTKVDTAARIDRLAQIDARFRSGGEIEGLRAAGFTGNAVFQSRQPLTETIGNTEYYSGSVANITGPVNEPACVTTNDYSRLTGRPGQSRAHLATPNTGSALFTNVDVHGEVTIYVDCTNWGQVLPGSPGAVVPPGWLVSAQTAATSGQGGAAGASAPAGNCLTTTQLKTLGTVLLYQDTDGKTVAENSGKVAGVQIRVKDTWQKPDGWTFHYQGNTAATSIPAGQTGTAWSPTSCRPLAA